MGGGDTHIAHYAHWMPWTRRCRLGEAKSPGFINYIVCIGTQNVTSLPAHADELDFFAPKIDVLCMQETRCTSLQLCDFSGILRQKGWEALFGTPPERQWRAVPAKHGFCAHHELSAAAVHGGVAIASRPPLPVVVGKHPQEIQEKLMATTRLQEAYIPISSSVGFYIATIYARPADDAQSIAEQ